MTSAAASTIAQIGPVYLIHNRGVEGKPSVEDVSSALRALGFHKAHETVIRHGVVDCATAIAYVAAQRGRYAARNPGALVRWLLDHKDSLTGWHWSRVRGFLVRFRSLPHWMGKRLARWLGLRTLPARWRRKRKAPRDAAPSPTYTAREEGQRAKARDVCLFADMLARHRVE